ncbi:MAG: hypothetical protein ACLS61_18535 [Ruminococcus sp.]
MQKSEIVAAPFSVTVTAGQTITKTFSVTRIINDDQIRFVLRWGDEESGAPSDLDSHLVWTESKRNWKLPYLLSVIRHMKNMMTKTVM